MSKKKIVSLAIALPAAAALCLSAPVAANASNHKPPCSKKVIKKTLNDGSSLKATRIVSRSCQEKNGTWWAGGNAIFGGEDEGVYLLKAKKKNGKWMWKDNERRACKNEKRQMKIPSDLRYVCTVS